MLIKDLNHFTQIPHVFLPQRPSTGLLWFFPPLIPPKDLPTVQRESKRTSSSAAHRAVRSRDWFFASGFCGTKISGCLLCRKGKKWTHNLWDNLLFWVVSMVSGYCFMLLHLDQSQNTPIIMINAHYHHQHHQRRHSHGHNNKLYLNLSRVSLLLALHRTHLPPEKMDKPSL